MLTLSELTRRTAGKVTRTVKGSTTTAPGNGTQVIDVVNLAPFTEDTEFVGGTVWITSGANAGLSRPVTSFSASNDRLTVPAFPNNILSGVTFEVVSGDFSEFRDLRQAVNNALDDLGYILDKDDSLTIVPNQLVYDLPEGVSRIHRVEIIDELGEENERRYTSAHWQEINGQLVFDDTKEPRVRDGETIRLWFEIFHPTLTDDEDEINYQVDPMYLIHVAARQAFRLAYMRFGKAGKETIPEWLNEAAENAIRHHRRNMLSNGAKVRTA